jgi:hypothetical protein
MKTETIVMCVVALLLGMLLANMLKNVCGCKTVEGQGDGNCPYECIDKITQNTNYIAKNSADIKKIETKNEANLLRIQTTIAEMENSFNRR